MVAGVLSILLTFEGIRTGNADYPYYRVSAMLIMVAMILDGLDGNVARWLRGTSEYGAELDTYVDLTAFGIAPAVIVFAVSLQNQNPLWRVLLPTAVVVSGMVRLARFKVKDPSRGQNGYAGLPITANAAWIALFVFISQASSAISNGTTKFSLNEGWFATLFLLGIVLFIILQVTNLRYPKPTKNVALFSLCVILVMGLLCAGLRIAIHIAFIIILLGLAYVVVGPFIHKRSNNK